MARGKCPRHPDCRCTCAMGHLYRFIEPVLLLLVKERRHAHGYDLANALTDYAFTDSEIERGALYRVLNTLEENGLLQSEWDAAGSGPARKVYSLTKDGDQHLREWSQVLTKMSKSMRLFVRKVDALKGGLAKPVR
jgi:PadR family transcriptional regulator, regulatory protein PadR